MVDLLVQVHEIESIVNEIFL